MTKFTMSVGTACSPRSQPRSGGSGVPSSESCIKAKAKAKGSISLLGFLGVTGACRLCVYAIAEAERSGGYR